MNLFRQERARLTVLVMLVPISGLLGFGSAQLARRLFGLG
jgi:hypothetical protein